MCSPILHALLMASTECIQVPGFNTCRQFLMFQLLELLALASDLYCDIPGQRFVLGGILQMW